LVGLILLLMASGMGIYSVKDLNDKPPIQFVFALGPAGTKAWLLGDVLRWSPWWKVAAILSLLVHASGVGALLWAQRWRGIVKAIPIFVFAMGIMALLFGLAVPGRLWKELGVPQIDYRDGLPWLVLFDVVTMAASNGLIGLLASKISQRLTLATFVLGPIQVLGMLMLLLVFVFEVSERLIVWVSAVVYAIGALGMTVVVL